MSETGEMSLEEEAKALRKGTTKGRRLLLFAFVGHLLILTVLVGLPYLRGRRRAEEGKIRLARYAACLLGGVALESPGLALPDEAPEHYADAARSRPWEACSDSLAAVAPADAFWLFPSTRHAESEVRRAVDMALGELRDAESAPPHQTPERPWLALQRVVAALTLWTEAADVQGNIFDPSVRFEAAAQSVRPERIPIQAAVGATLDMRTHADGVALVALDERGISWVRVAAGALDGRRMRRSGLIRDGLYLAGDPWLIWATPDLRCHPNCSRRAMGMAQLRDSDAETPAPVFVGAHPAGAAAESVALSETHIWVAAKREAGVALMRFPRAAFDEARQTEAQEGGPGEDGDGEGEGEGDEVEAPLRGEVVGGVRRLRHATLALASAEGLWGIDEEGRVVDGRAQIRARDARWIRSAGGHVFAGTRDAVLRFEGAGVGAHSMPPLAGVELRAEGPHVALAGLAGDTLHVLRCAEVCEAFEIPGVHSFALALVPEGLVIAHAAAEESEVRVQRWREGELSEAEIPSPCWSETGGFCAPIAAAFRDGRVVLGGRDGQDLMAIETTDEGWRRLQGLR